MDSAYSSLLYIVIIIYIITIYYSEKDKPNSITNELSITPSIIKWFCLIFLIFGELAMAFSMNVGKENGDLQTVKILFAVIFTWLLLFTPTMYFYYFGESSNGINGKPSIYINSIFENVIGYLFVKNEANNIFKNLNLDENGDGTKKKEIEEIMIEINKSRAIFINQLNIFNFENIWDKLFSKLLKPGSTDENKNKLLDLVRQKYIIGKCTWFLYNCIMCLSISLYLVVI
jgi:hypothetical protein